MYRQNEILGKTIIKSLGGDVKGSKKEDIVYLVGKKEGESSKSLYRDLEIIVLDGGNGDYTRIPIRTNVGYNPYILLENFTGDCNKEILFISNTEDSDGKLNIFIYGFVGDKEIEIFDDENFYTSENYEVIYNDNYKLTVLDYENNKKYTLDISDKSKVYLDKLYSDTGKLKTPKKGKISPTNKCCIIKTPENKADLLMVQDISGENSNDKLGVVLSRISYIGESFKNISTFIASDGIPIELDREYRYIKEDLEESKLSIDFTMIDFMDSEENRNYKIERVLESEYKLKPGVDKLVYYYNKVDLNNDNKNEVIVYLEGPRFCDEEGGTLVVLKEFNDEYRIISKIKEVQVPIIISNEVNNNFKDIILKVNEKNFSNYRALKFNGNSYPANPKDGYKLKKGYKVRGISIISDDLFYSRGLEYN
ncbi:hypothetical protein [Clostridium chauvoei]